MIPAGVRNQEGEIVQLKRASVVEEDDETGIQYHGLVENIPSNLQEVGISLCLTNLSNAL
jgi:hypothetical protein